ncbi:hypothetical protein [Borreliella lusitaniae]|uniref:DZANK-type domain-containing protein n=1 Tax=Borreliella lusitaniae TaxID=100177 RepID=A0ABZ0CNV7_9SPIR|nr:hypothetical protein [Borreliella lusitaniae]WKC85555.1 hypothetical protein QIA24_04035 [Borreliella lusitaniae]WNY68844.1 hypothetical protein QIA44_03330 [Borreliella lusitaniae]
MAKVNFEVFCEQCGEKVGLNKSVCPNCAAKLGDIECPNCRYVGPVSAFGEGCPNCHYSPFQELKEKPFKRKERTKMMSVRTASKVFSRLFNFGINVDILLYLFSSFLLVILFLYIVYG